MRVLLLAENLKIQVFTLDFWIKTSDFSCFLLGLKWFLRLGKTRKYMNTSSLLFKHFFIHFSCFTYRNNRLHSSIWLRTEPYPSLLQTSIALRHRGKNGERKTSKWLIYSYDTWWPVYFICRMTVIMANTYHLVGSSWVYVHTTFWYQTHPIIFYRWSKSD